jgi:phosphate transport system permease protein
MVVGNSPQITASLLKPGYTMPALLANQFNEAYTDDMQRSALLEVALILFAVTFLVNAIARAIILGSPKFNRLTLRGVLSESRSMLLRRIGLAILATALAAGIGQGILHSGLNALGSGLPLIASILFLAIILSAGIKMIVPQITRRHMAEYLASSAFGLCATCACLVLGAIFFYIASQGAKGLSLHFFTELPRPPGIEGGGLKSAIVGTIELVGIAAAIGIPVGVLGGLYLSEFARGTTLGAIASFAADVLNGIPSVVIGLFAYAAFVIPTKHFSAWAGGGALAVMTIPTITRTTQEVLMLLPQQYREAALGLGATRAQAIWTVILPAARAGILTGVILAIARVAGETAPLLFTAFGTDQLNLDPSQPVSSLTMKIYQYAISPYPDWIQLAWTGALVLLILIAISSVLSRVVLRR